jgi:hypothetical protein
MTSIENDFIQKLKHYFNDNSIINEYATKRILVYLNEYKNSLPPIVKHVNVVKERKQIFLCPPIKKIPVFIDRATNSEFGIRPTANLKKLKEEALAYCEENSIELITFLRKRKCTQIQANQRINFCHFMIQKYDISQESLRELFDVNHATISYYLSKRENRKKQQLNYYYGKKEAANK